MTREEILAANILPHRPAPERNNVRESRALDQLIARINGAPGKALQGLVDATVALTGAGSAGVSILTHTRFVWPVIAGQWARYAGVGMPLDASPCRIVIERNQALLFDRPDRLFPEAAGEPRIEELLLVPLSAGSAPFGTLWALSHDDYRFNSEDARILQRLSLFAAAIQRSEDHDIGAAPTAIDRIRNTLTIIRMIVRRISERDMDVPAEQVAAELGSRIGVYADIMLRNDAADPADLWLLLADSLRSAGEREGERVVLDGPPLALGAEQAALIALAMHELLDNAMRFGALGEADGRIRIEWDLPERDGRTWIRLRWIETSTTLAFAAATRDGFGFDLLRHAIPQMLGGHATIEARPPGLRFECEMPLDHQN